VSAINKWFVVVVIVVEIDFQDSATTKKIMDLTIVRSFGV
jgi:hypothetical protein